MSTDLARQLREDRMMRDAARALVSADIANLRSTYAAQSLSSRVIDRIGDGASDVLDEAVSVAENNKGVIATLLAAIVLWFARHPIGSLFDGEDDADPEGREAEAGTRPSLTPQDAAQNS
ncbi:hypothetical protein GRI40_02255 [Altererythrobacter aerius]|uniref:Uncharacterized protein n=1 Tax=Tsuneonella aeria TaxID=1837929 RepID=A0A6I4TAA4_9SPHN|nr:hypothetical protein [Tsuneonella aeria]MXO74043.1 hypothetical protein [Tsuneonella aeria]